MASSIFPRRAGATLAAATLLAAASTGSLACSSCGCTLDADWATQGVTTRTGWTADLRYDFSNQNDLRSGLHRVDRAAIAFPSDDEIQQQTVNRNATLTLDWGVDADLGLTVQLPWLERRHTTIAEGDTAAKPEIWSQPDKFKNAALKMQDAVAKLNEAAKSGNQDAIKTAFGAAGETCKGCHDEFKRKH